MAQLIVRNLEDAVVRALRERAAKKGRGTSLKALLRHMPDAGDDDDFTRLRSKRRTVRL